jgi:hypothetical protein
MRKPALIIVAALTVLVSQAAARTSSHRPRLTQIGEFSSQVSPNSAVAGAQISVRAQTARATGPRRPVVRRHSAPSVSPVVLPSLPADSPRLKDAQPAGPGSMWYQGSPGQTCIYIPDASPDCFVIVSPGRGAAADLSVAAAQLVGRLDLGLAGIEASPAASRDGLAGDQTWFWLADAPNERQVSITLAGETVTVAARPSQISWSFGDGVSVAGGSGTAYRGGAAPAEAITHVYQTRCLPGDRGRDPFALGSCESDGYHVFASTTWTISFTAVGPVSESGGLPARTTQSELVYPVSEARAFLTGGSR